MKKAAIYAGTVLLTAFGSVFAQNATTQNLNNAIQTSENIPQDVQNASQAIDELVLELTYVGNPDANAFHDALFVLVNNVQNNADDIDYFTGLAQSTSAVPFSTVQVNGLTAQLVTLNDDVIVLTGAITEAVLDNRNQDALNNVPALRHALAAQSETAGNVTAVLEGLLSSTTVYEVVIQLVNAEGMPVYYTDLHGYYTYSHATSQYLYPEGQDENVFFLTAGTYTFDSHDGYFSGTSSTTVTLSDELVNEDGVIVVELVYWSE